MSLPRVLIRQILFITDIYPAAEEPISGVDSRKLSLAIKEFNKDKAVYYTLKDEVVERVIELLKPKDLVITLGAGDISKLSDELAERLKSKE